MTISNAKPASILTGNGPALTAGIGCYVIWGLVPLVFQLIGRMGVSPWEILSHRTIWAVPPALAFVLLAKQSAQVRAVFRNPRVLGWLTLSAFLIAANWCVFIWAVNSGRVLETSLGYYLNPLLNMAAGALLFRERVNGIGKIAIGLAAIGVVIQAVALGHLPFVSIALALSFSGYAIVRKFVSADAQTGLLIECMILAAPSLVYLIWLEQAGGGHAFQNPLALLGVIACGPLTAIPLVLFSWAARRVPLSAMAFLQFIAPTMTFVMGVLQGEPFTPARAVSFACIWGGAAVFAFGAWRKARMVSRAAAEAAPI